jgi:hypothetical protein
VQKLEQYGNLTAVQWWLTSSWSQRWMAAGYGDPRKELVLSDKAEAQIEKDVDREAEL